VLKEYKEKYDIQHVLFLDENFFVNKKRVRQICEAY